MWPFILRKRYLWTDRVHHLNSCCVTDTICTTVVLIQAFIMLKFFLVTLMERASPISSLKCSFPPFLACSSLMRGGEWSLFNKSAQRCQTNRAGRHGDRNKWPLSGWIHLLHYGVNHISEIETPQKQECGGFFFLKPNCQLISHASNHLTQTKSSIYFSDRERAFIS